MKKLLFLLFVCWSSILNGQNPHDSIIPMYIEKVNFSAGEQVTMDVWSEDIQNLIAWQFRLNFENATIISIHEGEPFDVIPFNIFDEEKTINSLWTPVDAASINVGSNETWFTLTVEPTIDGSTFDIFTTTIDPWSAIGIEDETTIDEHEAEFVFNIESRNVLSANNTLEQKSIKLVSNLVTDHIELVGLSEYVNPIYASVYAVNGERLLSKQLQKNIDQVNIRLALFEAGIYWLTLESGEELTTFKFVKL